MEDERVSKFMQAIEREAKERRLQMESETNRYIDGELKKAEDEILLESYNMIQNKIAFIRADIGRENSQRQLTLKRELFKLRDTITADVFEAAKKRLKDFTESSGYADFIINSVKKCAAAMGGSAIKVYLNERDLLLSDSIKAAVDVPVTFVTDSAIIIGGARVKKEGAPMLIDESLDTRLAAQHDWFNENSRLTLKNN